MNVISTSSGLTFSLDQDMVSILDSINYSDNSEEYILYKENNDFIAESRTEEKKIGHFSDEMSSEMKNNRSDSAENYSYDEKIDYISKNIEQKFISADIQDSIRRNDPENDVDRYTRSFSTNTSTAKDCSLYNAQGQGSNDNCWAASIATIGNYLAGASYTATGICDNEGYDYNTGVSISKAKSILAGYSGGWMYYELWYNTASWSNIKLNIDSKFPMYLSAVDINNSANGHAVTLYGYRTIGTTDYIAIWNSGINGGSGGTQIIAALGESTTFAYCNSTYRWRYTLCYVYSQY